jgi:hypothetical protein
MAGRPELFKPLLFADQDLDDIVADLAPPPGPLADALAHLRGGDPGEAAVVLGAVVMSRPDEAGGWHQLLLAAAEDRAGRRAAMVQRLTALAADAAESRIRLLAWNALRRRGEATSPERIEGVITEVEVGRGVDTLAAYRDGSARLLLGTGARVVWDAPDDRLAAPIAAVLAAAAALAATLPAGRLPGEPGAGMARLTLLGSSGPRAVEAPLATIWKPGSAVAPLFGETTALYERMVAIAGWDKPR